LYYVPLLLTALIWCVFLTWCTDISAPVCPPLECPEGFKVSLKETDRLKTPDESSTSLNGRFKGVFLSDPVY